MDVPLGHRRRVARHPERPAHGHPAPRAAAAAPARRASAIARLVSGPSVTSVSSPGRLRAASTIRSGPNRVAEGASTGRAAPRSRCPRGPCVSGVISSGRSERRRRARRRPRRRSRPASSSTARVFRSRVGERRVARQARHRDQLGLRARRTHTAAPARRRSRCRRRGSAGPCPGSPRIPGAGLGVEAEHPEAPVEVLDADRVSIRSQRSRRAGSGARRRACHAAPPGTRRSARSPASRTPAARRRSPRSPPTSRPPRRGRRTRARARPPASRSRSLPLVGAAQPRARLDRAHRGKPRRSSAPGSRSADPRAPPPAAAATPPASTTRGNPSRSSGTTARMPEAQGPSTRRRTASGRRRARPARATSIRANRSSSPGDRSTRPRRAETQLEQRPRARHRAFSSRP